MPLPLLALAIPEGIGLTAGLIDWGLGAAGFNEQSNLRRFFDILDSLSIINNILEGTGTLPHPIGTAGGGWQASEMIAPWVLPGLGGKAAAAAGLAKAAPTAAASGWIPALSTARTWGAGFTAGLGGYSESKGKKKEESQTTTGPQPQPQPQPLPQWLPALGQAVATQDLLRQAVANYPTMLAETARLQAMRDAENARRLQEAYSRYMQLIPQFLPVSGNYPLY